MSRGFGMEQARGVEDLIGGIYDAAADPDLWSHAIAQIVEANRLPDRSVSTSTT